MRDRDTSRLDVEHTLGDVRLDAFLRTRFPTLSRGAIQRLIEGGNIQVDGRRVKASHRPKRGEQIEIRWPELRPSSARPEPIPLDILFEDDDLLVLNKAPGIVVHPSAGHEEHTLVNALLHHCAGGLSGIGGVARPGIVHRLDKETSGCLVVAKSDPVHLALSAQFAARKVEKRYHAIVCGNVAREQGEIRAAIARHPSHRKRMAVTDGKGREAWTSYRVLQQLNGAAWIEATLHTGRTHQIRVHFKHIGHPLLGDVTYGNRQSQAIARASNYEAPRLLLHACRLALRHPITGAWMNFEAPPPEDLKEALRALT